ncbi:MAG: hypothetical protein E7315_04215 [Clostridiales bacterium]|nr:hypothetical protein [Clostridiales bacterium]
MKNLLKKNISYNLFLIIYVIAIIIPSMVILTKENAVIDIALSFGLLILMVWYACDKRRQTASDWGISNIYTRNEELRFFMDIHRMHYWNEVDILLVYHPAEFLSHNIDELSVMAKIGAKIRILLMDPESQYISCLEEHLHMKKGEYAFYALQLQNWAKKIAESPECIECNIEIKFFDDFPPDNMFRAHDKLFSYSNKMGTGSKDVLTYVYEKDSKGYERQKKLYDYFWQESVSYKKEITMAMIDNFRYHSTNNVLSYKF